MDNYTIIPTVNATREFLEIANDFANPLELVREAISNSYDANASLITVLFDVIQDCGESVLRIRLQDNGEGMDRLGLQAFFDLGNSMSREDPTKIGEKGHGTKVYFNSSRIRVVTYRNGERLEASVDTPFRSLHNGTIPQVKVSAGPSSDSRTGTEIEIIGYNNNRRDRFTHAILKDYILWFTKHGSIEHVFNTSKSNVRLRLQGLDSQTIEEIEVGHPFPGESPSITSLFDTHLAYAPDHYCKRIVRTGTLSDHPEVTFEAVFSIEGSRVKYDNNLMLRRSGYQSPKGAYTVQERYGLWLCKDYIPIQRKNDWIGVKGTEYTRFHAFVNCQDLRLTANRGSIENTPSEKLSDLKNTVRQIYEDIVESNDWRDLDWLESQAGAFRTVEKERRDYGWRVSRINKTNIAVFEGTQLVEPTRESGVFALYILVAQKKPELFPFYVLDYDTHEGIDVIVKSDATTPISQSKLFYVEFKHILTKDFNHSFENVHSIVCWDTQIKHSETVEDITGETRKLMIVQPEKEGDYTKYFLDNEQKARKVEVFVLKSYLKEKLGIDFKPRTTASVL